MTVQQAIEALHALPRLGAGQPGLARMQNLLAHLGSPEKDLPCIHIAGTNGKGSLAVMTASILTAAGYKTGLTISPYVVEFRERFQQAFLAEMTEFFACIRDGRKPELRAEDGTSSTRVVLATKESFLKKQLVTIQHA